MIKSLVLWGWVLSPFLATENETLLVWEKFQPTGLTAPWSWVREKQTGWRFDNGNLLIQTTGKIWGSENNQRNILLRPLPQTKGAIAVEVMVNSGLKLNQPYEHGGLIWYWDDDHWVTLTQLNHVADQTQKIMLVHEDRGQGRPLQSSAVPYKKAQVQLRLVAKGRLFQGFYRPTADSAWVRLGSIQFPEHKGQPKIGLVAGDGRPGSEHWVTFDDFKIYHLPL